MHRILPIFILSVFGISFAPLLWALPSIAYRQMTTSATVGATMHLEPNDMPHAGRASKTWFMLTQRGGSLIPSANCRCQMVVYDAGNRALSVGTTAVHQFPLSPVSVDHHQAIGTTVTFPKAGTYTVVLSGQAQDKSFDPFELIFPVVVNP
ncbi:MAG TPA: hypothetical protein V6C57_25295 [Coleofasciculaceae cyanobacterium]